MLVNRNCLINYKTIHSTFHRFGSFRHSNAHAKISVSCSIIRIDEVRSLQSHSTKCVTSTLFYNCWQYGAISNASGPWQIFYQHSALHYTLGTTMNHWGRCHLRRAPSSHVNIPTLSLRQKHTHTLFLPYGTSGGGEMGEGGGVLGGGVSLPHSNKHSSALLPPPPLDTRVHFKPIARLLIWAAYCTPACCPGSQYPHTGCKENYSLFSPHNKSVGAQRAAAFT